MGELTAGVTNDASGSLHALVERVQDEPWSLVIALGAVLLALRLLGLRRGPTCRPASCGSPWCRSRTARVPRTGRCWS